MPANLTVRYATIATSTGLATVQVTPDLGGRQNLTVQWALAETPAALSTLTSPFFGVRQPFASNIAALETVSVAVTNLIPLAVLPAGLSTSTAAVGSHAPLRVDANALATFAAVTGFRPSLVASIDAQASLLDARVGPSIAFFELSAAQSTLISPALTKLVSAQLNAAGVTDFLTMLDRFKFSIAPKERYIIVPDFPRTWKT